MKVIRDHPERRFQVGNVLASERAMIKALLEGDGFRPGITFEDAELHGVRAPTLMIFGAADPTGDPSHLAAIRRPTSPRRVEDN